MIDRAVRESNKTGKPNLSKIVEKLQGWDPRFEFISYRRLGEWRDETVKDQLVWSEKTLQEVKKGFLPGGDQTRHNVFVCLP